MTSVTGGAAFYEEQGYLLARGVVGAAEVEELRAALDRVLERLLEAFV